MHTSGIYGLKIKEHFKTLLTVYILKNVETDHNQSQTLAWSTEYIVSSWFLPLQASLWSCKWQINQQ